MGFGEVMSGNDVECVFKKKLGDTGFFSGAIRDSYWQLMRVSGGCVFGVCVDLSFLNACLMLFCVVVCFRFLSNWTRCSVAGRQLAGWRP